MNCDEKATKIVPPTRAPYMRVVVLVHAGEDLLGLWPKGAKGKEIRRDESKPWDLQVRACLSRLPCTTDASAKAVLFNQQSMSLLLFT